MDNNTTAPVPFCCPPGGHAASMRAVTSMCLSDFRTVFMYLPPTHEDLLSPSPCVQPTTTAQTRPAASKARPCLL